MNLELLDWMTIRCKNCGLELTMTTGADVTEMCKSMGWEYDKATDSGICRACVTGVPYES